MSSVNTIEVKNISKIYGKQRALADVSFSIGKGEVVGFLGPNGAGKSTMMKILTTYIKPTYGSAFISGHDVLEQEREVKKIVGYLPEHNPLYLDMYVKERVIIIDQGVLVADNGVSDIVNTKSTKVLEVEFSGSVKQKDLEQLPEALKVRNVGGNQWEIEIDETRDIRETVFAFAVDNNVAILTQNYSSRSLEEAFKDLTKK